MNATGAIGAVTQPSACNHRGRERAQRRPGRALRGGPGSCYLEQAFPADVAAACVDELWLLSGVDRDDRGTWTEPVVRVGGSGAAPLVTAINTERLCGAVDQLVGARRWQRRQGYGTFPIRFPSEHDPGDTGWHIDGSFEIGTADPPWNYGVNLWSEQRALLVLMLYSDVGMADAPTHIRVGSHLDVAPLLVPYGDAGPSPTSRRAR